MNKKTLSVLKLLVVVVIVALFVWFIFIKPSYNFSKYEKTLEEAAVRYYQLNPTELPKDSFPECRFHWKHPWYPAQGNKPISLAVVGESSLFVL